MTYLTNPTNARDLLLESVGSTDISARFVSNAKNIVVSSTSQVFNYATAGFTAGQFITVNATRANTNNPITWTTIPAGIPLWTAATGGTDIKGTSSQTTVVYLRVADFATAITAATTSSIQVVGTVTDGTAIYDSTTIVKLQQGSSALSVILSNESANIATDSAGLNAVYTGTGTNIYVYEGSNALAFQVSGTLTNGTWTVSALGTDILASTPAIDSGSYATYGIASNIGGTAVSNASIAYTITGKSSTGIDFTVTKVQNFSKSKQGIAGNYVDYIFRRSDTTLTAAPEGNTPAAPWYDAPPSGTALLWVSSATKTYTGALVGTWSAPAKLGGEGVTVQYAPTDTGAWVDTYRSGTDLYMRQKIGTGDWSSGIKIVGEDGNPGHTGNYIDYMFQRSAGTPINNAPGGLWYDAPPAGTLLLWVSSATKTYADVVVGTWSDPVQLSGEGITVEYATTETGTWHPTFATGDFYMRQKIGTGDWSSAIKIVGEKGATGAAGSNVILAQGDNTNAQQVVPSINSDRFVKINGTTVSTAYTIGHKLTCISSTTGLVTFTDTYNTYGASGNLASSVSEMSRLNAALLSITALDNSIIVLTSFDATSFNATLRATLNNLGGTLTDTWTQTRTSHVFIGAVGLSKGQGFEKVTSTYVPVTVSAYFTTNGLIVNGVMGVDGNKGDTAVFAYQVLTSTAMPSAPSIAATQSPTATTAVSLASGVSSTTLWYTLPRITLLSNEWQFQVSGTRSYLGVYTWQTQGYLSTFKVGKLDALSADIGAITAGSITGVSLKVGTAPPTITGTGITSGTAGALLNTDGSFALGKAGTSIVADTAGTITLTGKIVQTGNVADLAIGSGQIAADAITANKINAGAITTSKLLVTSRGPTLTADPMGQDAGVWPAFTLYTGLTGIPGGGTTAIGTNAGAIIDNGYSTQYIAIDSTKNYKFEALAKQVNSSTGTGYFAFVWYSDIGVATNASGNGWPSGYVENTYAGLANTVIPNDWTRYIVSFGPNETYKIPAAARYVKLGVFLNYYTNGGGTCYATNIRLMEKTSADLIVDGAVTASKINITNGETTSKVVISNNLITIYDSNVIRVKLGNLA